MKCNNGGNDRATFLVPVYMNDFGQKRFWILYLLFKTLFKFQEFVRCCQSVVNVLHTLFSGVLECGVGTGP